MPVSVELPGYHWFHVFKNVAVRMGVYVGVCLSLVMGAWIFVANRMPLLERFARERNLAATAVLGFLFILPALRFLRSPGYLLSSGLIAWAIFSFTYRLLCMFFELLGEKYGTFRIFVLGFIVYMILSTLSWIGTMFFRVRPGPVSHPKHQHHVS